jgi:hypothetical protein
MMGLGRRGVKPGEGSIRVSEPALPRPIGSGNEGEY